MTMDPQDNAQRPRVICHMMASIDGRIVVNAWPDVGDARGEYERTAAIFDADGWMCGRITMEPFAGAVRDGGEVAREAAVRRSAFRADFIAPGAHAPYAVAIDQSGRLDWQTNDISGDHVVTVLGTHVSDAYLDRLRSRGVSYLFAESVGGSAARGQVDLAVALRKLASTLGIRTLLLEGGGRINGSMLAAGLIDEISLLVAPVADGAIGTPSLLDVDVGAARRLTLESVERRTGDVLWLRYRASPSDPRP
jgi:riboflavin biosynthesis pyrimidine reductase